MMGGFGGMGMGWTWTVMFVVAVVAVFWGLMRVGPSGRRPGRGGDVHDQHDRSQEILRERYARGEIAEDEFRERLRALNHR